MDTPERYVIRTVNVCLVELSASLELSCLCVWSDGVQLKGNLILYVSASTGKVFWLFFRFTSNECIHCYQLKIRLQFDFVW